MTSDDRRFRRPKQVANATKEAREAARTTRAAQGVVPGLHGSISPYMTLPASR